MDKEKLEKYAALKSQIKELEALAEPLKKEIEESMINDNLDEVSFDSGKVALQSKKKWTYPQEIVEEEETLKAKKKAAEQLGTATFAAGAPYVVFYPAGEGEAKE